jgi:uncharacterized membrane protein
MSKEKILWGLFFIDLVIILFHLLGGFVGIGFAKSQLVMFLVLAFPLLIFFLHAIWILSPIRALLFIILASSLGFLAEYAGLNSGVIFGGHYVYQARSLMLLNVPMSVILYWAVFTYLGYSVVNSFLYWRNQSKPNFKQKNYLLLIFLCLSDAFVVTAIDLFMDPLQVHKGNWTWLEGGPYFGVPIGNFAGWFVLVLIITGIFRSFEYFNPGKIIPVSKSIALMAVLAYVVIWLAFVLSAIEIKMYDLILIGSLFMLPPVLLSSFVAYKNKVV